MATIVKIILPIALDGLTQFSLGKFFPQRDALRTNTATTMGALSMFLISRNLDRIPNVMMIGSYVLYKLTIEFIRSSAAQIDQTIRAYYNQEQNDERQQRNRPILNSFIVWNPQKEKLI